MNAPKLKPNLLEKLSPFPYRRLGRAEYLVSPICFGSLRLTPENEMYKESLRTAFATGINFIDSSGSYGDGASELLIGEVIHEKISSGEIQRDQVVVSTKIGTLQGRVFVDAMKREQLGHPFPGIIKLSDQMAHCISPDYLEFQITTSLRRLNLDHVDFVFLQAPEMMLTHGKSKQDMLVALKKAFEHLEVEVMKGRIRYYGIASSALLKKDIASDFINLSEINDIAKAIRPNHHFAAAQIPFNLFETYALTEKNHKGRSVFEVAKELDLAVVTCRPLTSHHRDKLHHFITFPERDEAATKGKLHQNLLELIELEKEMMSKLSAYPSLNWGHFLRDHLESICDLWKWTNYIQRHMRPKTMEQLSFLPQDMYWDIWKNKYIQKLNLVTRLVTETLESISNLRTNQISLYLEEKNMCFAESKKLSNKVTQMYLSFTEIDSIIMGLGSPEFVKDLQDIKSIPQQTEMLPVLTDVKMRF
jgi:aryl-alcohol dehydrogenase-like predicted oxidoreductase